MINKRSSLSQNYTPRCEDVKRGALFHLPGVMSVFVVVSVVLCDLYQAEKLSRYLVDQMGIVRVCMTYGMVAHGHVERLFVLFCRMCL